MSEKKCTAKTEVYSRVVGYYRPVQQWNVGKKTEYFVRKTYSFDKSEASSEQLQKQAS